jgi:hypothetical protein
LSRGGSQLWVDYESGWQQPTAPPNHTLSLLSPWPSLLQLCISHSYHFQVAIKILNRRKIQAMDMEEKGERGVRGGGEGVRTGGSCRLAVTDCGPHCLRLKRQLLHRPTPAPLHPWVLPCPYRPPFYCLCTAPPRRIIYNGKIKIKPSAS